MYSHVFNTTLSAFLTKKITIYHQNLLVFHSKVNKQLTMNRFLKSLKAPGMRVLQG